MRPLSFSDYPTHVAELIEAALAAADPATAVLRHLHLNNRSLSIGADTIIHTHYPADGRIYLVSAGKAAIPMARAAAGVLGEQLSGGIIVAKRGERDWQAEMADTPFAQNSPSFALYEAGHPVSDEQSERAAQAVAELLTHTSGHDLVLSLISGGTSALLARPIVPLADWQRLTDVLLKSGCTINELNSVRRQLDSVKGGGLARWAAPAACVSLILSDVVGNPLDVIGSGPTVQSQETLADAVKVLARYQVAQQLDVAVWQRIVQALHQLRHQPQPLPARAHNLIVGDVRQAATSAMVRAAQLGFAPQLLTAQLEGEAREAGRFAAALAKDAQAGSCLILGGETTVTVRGTGLGGRNQETALSAAIALSGHARRVVASFATDGEDGPTDAAGAVVSGDTVANGRYHHIDALTFLDRNDSYHFFHQLDRMASEAENGVPQCHLLTGPTGTNVNDLIFVLAY